MPVHTRQGTNNLIQDYWDILLALQEQELCSFVTVGLFV